MPDMWWEKDMRDAQRRGFWSGLFCGMFGTVTFLCLVLIVLAVLGHFE